MKKQLKYIVLFIFVTALTLCFGGAFSAWASSAAESTAVSDSAAEEIVQKYSIVLSDTSFVYNGAVQRPTVKVVNNINGKTVSKKKYTVTYENKKSKDVGKYSVTVSFTAEAYTKYGDLTAKYKITALSLKNNATITLKYTKVAYNGNKRTPAVTVTLNGKTLTKGTDYTVTYANNKNPGRATVKITGINNYKGSVKKGYVITPKAVSGIKCTERTSDSVTLSWKQAKGADGYKIYQYNSVKKEYKLIKTIKDGSTTSYKVTSLNNSSTYRFVIKPYVTISGTNYKGPKGTSFQTYTSVAKYSGTITVSRSANSTSMAVKYTAAKYGTGYEIKYSYDSEFEKGVKYIYNKGLSNLSETISSLSGTKSYYVKVRIYVETADGKKHYGKWSSAVCDYSYKTKATVSVSKSANSTKMTVKYTKSPYGSGYEIAYSTDQNFKSNVKKVYVKGLSTTSATITSLSASKGYYVRVRPYTTVDSRRVYGTYSSITSTGYKYVYATYTTAYVNNANRTTNLKIASAAINGTVIAPGETFDFNEIVGPRTEAKGYKKAPVFSGSSVVSGVGGGICQVASTIFNTALLSNFTINERHQHSQQVSYVPLGRDAAIYYSSQNLRWTNSSNYNVKIQMTVDGGYITCTLLTESKVSPPSVSLKVTQSGNTYTLRRYVNGSCNYTTKSTY
ncbi:MAG: VanW family protein [Clostridiales bacterium]|nr:VanW family protein [Clostridiales bacterium]